MGRIMLVSREQASGERERVSKPALLAFLGALLAAACASHESNVAEPAPREPVPEVRQGPPTYYDDVQPLLARSCTGCHRAGGIGPFSLEDLASASAHAGEIVAATAERTMPPWLATADGSCGTFSGSPALSDAELERLRDWVEDGLLAGEPRVLAPAAVATLDGAVELSTPVFAPIAQGTELAEEDEYRCFQFDLGVSSTSYVTGFEVQPGTPSIVHHVLGMLVDLDAPAASGSGTNREQIAALKATSPDRDGWPCFGMAGDGVKVDGFPIVWGPGQPVIEYPHGSGVPVTSSQKLVLQVHYNLANHPPAGVTDQTQIRLRFAPSVRRLGGFLVVDPFLDSLHADPPDTLAPGQASVTFRWENTANALGIGRIPGLTLEGVMPHMHGRARQYRLELGSGSSDTCALDIEQWDMHWQRLYFYADPPAIGSATRFNVSCDYDTSSDQQPVTPGWGIANEMCATIFYLSAPNPEIF
jgi:hypothetical protein